MDYDTQLQLQAYLDGELPERAARQLRVWLEEDPEAKALLAELENTRTLLTHYDEGILLPESREFFWSKIEREILAGRKPASRPGRLSVFPGLRYLVPAGSLAALVVATLLAVQGSGGSKGSEYEATLSDPGALTYRDYASGTTLVWLSYPAEHELADDEPSD